MPIWIQYKCQTEYNTKENLGTIYMVIGIYYKGQYGYNTYGNRDILQREIWVQYIW